MATNSLKNLPITPWKSLKNPILVIVPILKDHACQQQNNFKLQIIKYALPRLLYSRLFCQHYKSWPA